MKQFNLEEYLKNPTKKVITRDGRSARIICTDAKGNFPIIALVETYNGNETVLRLKENGRFYNDTENSRDLFFAPIKKEGWVNMYKTRSGAVQIGQIYSSKEEEMDEDYFYHFKDLSFSEISMLFLACTRRK